MEHSSAGSVQHMETLLRPLDTAAVVFRYCCTCIQTLLLLLLLEPRAVFAGTDDRKGKGRSYK